MMVSLATGTDASAELYNHTAVCDPDFKPTAHDYLSVMSTGWRPLQERRWGEFGIVNEQENAHIVYATFRKHGYSKGIAFAAVANAWAESALDNTAVMDDPFSYRGKAYPGGSGAIGLFQLLPSRSGAGGPSGPEQGYSRSFEDGRYAGSKWEASQYYDTPSPWGRRYYDATDPVLNTERIVLEVERDGALLIAAAKRGASIADLTHIFGREIERPQHSTWYRRRLAAKLFGDDVAWARNPDDLFADDPNPAEDWAAIAAMVSPAPEPEPEPVIRAAPVPMRASLGGGFYGIALLVMLGLTIRRP